MFKILRRFYGFILKDWPMYLFYLVLVAVATTLATLTPYFYKLFVEVLPSLNYEKILQILLIYVGVNIASLLISEFGFVIGDKLMFDAAIRIRKKIFSYVQDLDFAFHTSKSTGSLISAFKRGDGAFFDLYTSLHHRVLEVVVGICVVSYFFLRIDYRIFLTIVVAGIVVMIASRFIIALNVAKRKEFNEEEDKVSGVIGDNMINYETVKLFAKEDWEQKRLAQFFVPWLQKLWGYSLSFRVIDLSAGAIINTTLVVILLLSLKRAVNLEITIGDFVLIAGFTNMFFPQVWQLIWSLRDIAKSQTDLNTYFSLLDNIVEVKDPENPIKIDHVAGEIEFKNVKFIYKDKNKKAVNDFSLDIASGESIALVGRSGSGKTTIAKLLMRFFDPQEGTIKIDGVNLKDFKKSTLRSFMGVVPQEPILFNNTIGYNIAYGKGKATKDEIRKAAKIANIDDFIEGLPLKYETQVGERGVKLSGGQKQRLAIARMILSNPDIILFDEATSHLDSESEKLIQDAFWKVAKGKTTIVIAHRLSTIMKADRIVVMEKGKIKEIGSHEELLQKEDGLYNHFWKLQTNID